MATSQSDFRYVGTSERMTWRSAFIPRRVAAFTVAVMCEIGLLVGGLRIWQWRLEDALLWAIIDRQTEVATRILERYPGLATTPLSGDMPLDLACGTENPELVRTLIKSGARPTVSAHLILGNRDSAEALAREAGFGEVEDAILLAVRMVKCQDAVELLGVLRARGWESTSTSIEIERGATRAGCDELALDLYRARGTFDPWTVAGLGLLEEWRQHATSDQTGLHSIDPNGWTPLHWAARRGRAELALELVRSGANPNAVTDGGWTPSELAEQAGAEGLAAELAVLETRQGR